MTHFESCHQISRDSTHIFESLCIEVIEHKSNVTTSVTTEVLVQETDQFVSQNQKKEKKMHLK